MSSVISAFSLEQAARLSGVTERQLTSWDRTGFFEPSLGFRDRSTPHSRIYSFDDIVSLRTLALLRNLHRVPLQELRRAKCKLGERSSRPWSDTTIYVFNKRVVFNDPETNQPQEVVSGQYIEACIPLSHVADDVASAAEKLRQRDVSQVGKTSRTRHVVHNAWVIAGTRIPVAAIRSFAEAGYSVDEIIKEYPDLTPKDVKAALEKAETLTKAA
ncbi:DUF433 domain-containing protein [Sphingomonas koreensis]|uniref:DUF433 domain-containing protein n=1 Tax=Sphingomonas koreensis TaxID=93064 RepID=A0A430G968_9SPHN|nr:DUF433 domain-containing protein [Sphingomonas koreensis]RSY90585.1 DUF433 domain-containing protein [Sphingomonas koreensis]